jgi:hypothetical protein
MTLVKVPLERRKQNIRVRRMTWVRQDLLLSPSNLNTGVTNVANGAITLMIAMAAITITGETNLVVHQTRVAVVVDLAVVVVVAEVTVVTVTALTTVRKVPIQMPIRFVTFVRKWATSKVNATN